MKITWTAFSNSFRYSIAWLHFCCEI